MTRRYVARVKLGILREIATRKISILEAARIHDLSVDEIKEWSARYERFGIDGLKTTKLQKLRW